jgi:cardiolipin synthase (CMP-forming)
MTNRTSFGRQDGETPQGWLTRLEAIRAAGLTPHERMTLNFQKNLAQSQTQETQMQAPAPEGETLPARISPANGRASSASDPEREKPTPPFLPTEDRQRNGPRVAAESNGSCQALPESDRQLGAADSGGAEIRGAPRGVRFLSTLPNALSCLRLVLGLSFPWLPPSWRVGVVLVAALTDLLDGSSARLFRACSPTGRILDSVADKVFLFSALITLLFEGTLGAGEAVLVGLRDLIVLLGTAGLLLCGNRGVFWRLSPTWLGKAATVGQFAFLFVLLLAPTWRGWVFPLAAALSGLAALRYLWVYRAGIRPNGAFPLLATAVSHDDPVGCDKW